jgi:Na+-translocating ferredoxin:NAD+ oxidoreductase subunit B
MDHVTPEQIDDLLPQTQCGLCGHGGCMPYAEAMVFENAPINLCPPGGVNTLRALGKLLGKDPRPFLSEMEQKAKPTLLAVIREAECIGCTKCIQACPVDAILGSSKQMHTVITADCTGCELCVAPCPVDCIDMIESSSPWPEDKKRIADSARQRFNARQKRLAAEATIKKNRQRDNSQSKKQLYIQAAIERVKAKKI